VLISIKNRIYSDYLMPSRLDEYERIISLLVENNYKQVSIKEYYFRLRNNLLENKKYFINRHDIDTDVNTAKEFFRIEKKYGVKATYYFRLSTLDFEFMKEIEKYGSEASYHFEEIATFAKKHHIKSKEEILKRMNDIKNMFEENFLNIEEKLGVKLQTVCSHGDFVNRKLKITNNEITNDLKLREKLGIKCEAYDKELMQSFAIYVSDRPYPLFYFPKSIFEFIGNKNIICMLTHPRQWRVAPIINTFDNLKRLYEGIIW